MSFKFNDFRTLEKIFSNKIGAIKWRFLETFYQKTFKQRKKLASKRIVLIFDECTSGFRKFWWTSKV